MLTLAHAWLLTLLPLPLIVRRLAPPRVATTPAVRVPFLDRLKAAGADDATAKSESQLIPVVFRWMVWGFLVIALARPQFLEPPIERTIPTRDLLLLVDLSGSMQAEDFADESGKSIDRLTAAKEVLGQFLQRRKGDRVGLVVFGNAPFLQTPFTTDLVLCRRLLDETAVGMAGPRTALGDAIGLGIQLFENSDVPTRTIIALTDGNDTDSAVPPSEAARIAKDRQITIHTVAMGDPSTVGEERLDEQSLRKVSDVTGGQYFLAMDRTELAGIYEQLDAIETRKVDTVSHRPRRDLYFWPLAGALFVSLAGFAWTVFRKYQLMPPKESRTRLVVNARTFELEPTEQ